MESFRINNQNKKKIKQAIFQKSDFSKTVIQLLLLIIIITVKTLVTGKKN